MTSTDRKCVQLTYIQNVKMDLVLLGYPDDEDDNALTPPTFADNYIGGELTSLIPPHKLPSHINCPCCAEPMSFILQLYCPLGATYQQQHRNLFFFACLTPTCQTSNTKCCWRVLRLQQESCYQQEQPVADLFPSTDWGFGDNDDSANDELCGGTNWLQQIKAPRINITQNKEEVKTGESYTNCNFKSPFARRFIQVFCDETEELSEIINDGTNSLTNWILDYRAEDEFVEEDAKDRDNMRGIVADFTTKYQLYLASRGLYGCEAVRYAWCGVPIFPTQPPQPEWNEYLICSRCQGPRVFEVQLFSSLNNSLRTIPEACTVQQPMNTDWPLEMISVLVFSCKAACWQEGRHDWLEEFVIVQTEAGQSLISDCP